MIQTDEILNELKKKDATQFPAELVDAAQMDITEYLNELLKAKESSVSKLASRLPYDRSYLYQFFNGRRKPTRDLLLQIAVLLSLSTEETQKLLRVGQKAALYPKVRSDAAVIYALEHGLSFFDVDELLMEIGEHTLF